MNLARDKFLKLLKDVHRLHEKGVSIRMIGEVALLPMSVRQPAAELEAKTRHNTNYKLNICIAYTRWEFCCLKNFNHLIEKAVWSYWTPQSVS